MKTRIAWRSGASLLGMAAAVWAGFANPDRVRGVEVEVDQLSFFQSTAGGSLFSPPVLLDQKLVFGAVTNQLGFEPWTYDLSTELSQNIADQQPGINHSYPEYMVAFNGAVYFQSLVAPYVWRFDGQNLHPVNTAAGPHTVRTFQAPIVYQNQVYTRTYTQTTGVELFRFDGDAFELAADIQPNLPDMIDSQPHLLAVYRNELILTAWTSATGRNLYKYDGQNLTRFDDYDWTYGEPAGAVVFNDQLIFSAARGLGGNEIWRYDGNMIEQVADIYPGFSPDPDEGPDEIFIHSSHPWGYVEFQGKLYFSAVDADHGRELWSYDGVGVELAMDMAPGPESGWVGNLVVYDGALWFTTGQIDRKLWRFDGVEVSQAFDHSERLPRLMEGPVVLGGELYFSGVPDGQDGTELFRLTIVPLPGAAAAGGLLLGAMAMRRRRG